MKNSIIGGISFLFFISSAIQINAQSEAPSWIEYAEKKERGRLKEAALNDYSYSGYHFSEKDIPDVSTWTRFDVTDYGATPGDESYDDAGIRTAISAAVNSNHPAVVYFPAGKYLVADAENASNPIIINKSNIVLKGAGSGSGGTEIYADQCGDFPWRFHFIAENASEDAVITSTLNKRIYRGDFSIEVSSTRNLEVGQGVVLWHKGPENLEVNAPGLTYKSEWIRIRNNGIRPFEKHIIESIDGNKVTFVNPVQYTMTADISGAELRKYNTIEEVGVEDILFTSGWKNSPEIYEHHASDFVDYAYRALAFENVKNGWIRNCEIRDWNESLMIEKCIGVTVNNLLISGKQGHTSYFARRSYGVLFEDCRDIVPVGFKNAGGQGHGPGMRWSTVNTVFKNCEMQKHQSIDCHGYHPYSNLLDNVSGGSFYNNGGAENAYPNSGPYLTFWNFIHDAHYSDWTFDFWNTENRKNHTYMNPVFVGFRVVENPVTLKNTGLNELMGQEVYPVSLFDAQLQLRLFGGYMSASSSNADFLPVNANDGDRNTRWEPVNSGSDQWLMLDLGLAEMVYEVTIATEIDYAGEWKLEGYDNGNWTVLKMGTNLGGEKKISFDETINRKLRLTFSGMNEEDNSSVSVNDFYVSGSAGPVGILEFNKSNNDQVKIYPNPGRSFINIDLGSPGYKQISIFDTTGQLVWHNTTSRSSIRLTNITGWERGIYLVKVLGDNGRERTNKFIIN